MDGMTRQRTKETHVVAQIALDGDVGGVRVSSSVHELSGPNDENGGISDVMDDISPDRNAPSMVAEKESIPAKLLQCTILHDHVLCTVEEQCSTSVDGPITTWHRYSAKSKTQFSYQN